MQQLKLPLEIETQKTDVWFQRGQLLELWCAEPVFFASRELSDTYYTEGAIGNYALAYAMGWVHSPYRLTGDATTRPTYREDLGPLAQQCYILPAWPATGKVKFRFERFNALSDSYWFAMTNNRVATAREDLPLKRTGKKPNTYRASNFPQTGRLRMIDRGNYFHTLVLGEYKLPEYIRLGKFRSKVGVKVLGDFPVTPLPPGEYDSYTYLNVADLPSTIRLQAFDLIAMPPASLIKNLRFQGAGWQVGDYILPANLQFLAGRNYHG